MSVTCRFDEDKYVLRIYNDCYGGGSPSLNEEAKNYFDSMTGSESERLILTLEKFGCDCVKKHRGRRFTRFGLCLCPKECIPAYRVDEYDGLENPYIDCDAFLKHLIELHFETNIRLDFEQYKDLVEKSRSVELQIMVLN